jgi:hypothetical protein
MVATYHASPGYSSALAATKGRIFRRADVPNRRKTIGAMD